MYRVWKLYLISLVIWTCQNNLGFSLYVMLSVCYIVITSEKWIESERELSTDSGVLPLNTRE